MKLKCSETALNFLTQNVIAGVMMLVVVFFPQEMTNQKPNIKHHASQGNRGKMAGGKRKEEHTAPEGAQEESRKGATPLPRFVQFTIATI